MKKTGYKALSGWGMVWAVLVAVSALAGSLSAQCTSSSVLWVSELVDANVGLAAGGGRCTTNTVVGAAYDDPAQPFGIQAAFDCNCAGSEVRILAGANNYDSTTASWNNRFDATKQVNVQNRGFGDGLDQAINIFGYVDASTPCITNVQTNCPVLLDFTGGTASGLQFNSSPTFVVIRGLGFTGAANAGLVMQGARGIAAGLEAFGNGTGANRGLEWAGQIRAVDWYAHDNTGSSDGALLNGSLVIGEFHGNAGTGIVNNGTGGVMDRIISYDNAGAGIGISSGAPTVSQHYIGYSNTGDAYSGGTGNKNPAVLLSGIAVDNGGWAGINYVAGGTYMAGFACLISTGNTLGDYSPAGTPIYAGINYNIDNGAGVSYPAAPDFSPTPAVCASASNCGFTYYGTNTSAVQIPGPATGCGGGLTIQPVRRQQ